MVQRSLSVAVYRQVPVIRARQVLGAPPKLLTPFNTARCRVTHYRAGNRSGNPVLYL
jgi:hypothetical protein